MTSVEQLGAIGLGGAERSKHSNSSILNDVGVPSIPCNRERTVRERRNRNSLNDVEVFLSVYDDKGRV